jgi:hypothetical protein
MILARPRFASIASRNRRLPGPPLRIGGGIPRGLPGQRARLPPPRRPDAGHGWSHPAAEGPRGVAAPRRGRDDRPCKSWRERRRDEEAGLGYGVQPHRLIVSGGQGRIGLGARLERLGVPTIIVTQPFAASLIETVARRGHSGVEFVVGVSLTPRANHESSCRSPYRAFPRRSLQDDAARAAA